MTPQELKLSILRRAFQGKLVDQIFEEGTGVDLLSIIQLECHNKIINGQIKRFRAFPEISDEDSDFDVPDNWQLVRLGEVCQLLDGEKRAGETYPYLEARYLRGKTAPTIMTEGKYIAEGTNVILVDGENSGEVFRTSEDGYMGSTFKVLFVPEALLLEYVIYFLQLHKNTLRNNKKGAAIPHLNKDLFFNLILPIPPLAEQKRIVAKIKELIPLIYRYEQAWSRLEDFNKRFPVDMQKSILQMAIQGKLVPQLSEEGTGEELYQQIRTDKQRLIKAGTIKKEKSLPVITEKEIPFDIPESWAWVRLPAIADMCLGKMLDKQKNTGTPMEYLRNVNVRWGSFDLSDLLEMKFEDIEDERYLIRKNDIIMCEGGEPGRCAVWDEDTAIHFQKALHRIRLSSGLSATFFYYVFCLYSNNGIFSGLFTGTTIKHLTGQSLDKIIVPLPPLAEQKRIVAKLEEILPLCERLK